MQRNLSVAVEHYPIAGSFRISRGVKTQATVVTCAIREGGKEGRGECIPYGRYDETVEGVSKAIAEMGDQVSAGIDRLNLMEAMPPGAARNAIDCAMWELEAQLTGCRVSRFACRTTPRPLTTAYTISLGTPEKMAEDAAKAAYHSILKIKLGGTDDTARMRAVAAAAPDCRIIVDANEGWTTENLIENIKTAAENRVELIEQPLPVGKDGMLGRIDRIVPICADESAHVAEDLEKLSGLYDAVNIKLDKAGGLTAAITMHDKAKSLGMKIMIGCMVGTSLAMAPAVLLAQDADFVDLDGPLLLEKDREPGLLYNGSQVYPPEPDVWG